MKIRVIRYGGLPLDFASAVIRNLFRAVDIILFAMAVGFLIIFLSKQSQRTGDYVAGTVVIHDRNVSLSDLDKYLGKAYSPAQVVDRTIIGRFRKLSDEDARLIELFMEKRQEMTLDARREFAEQIALGIRTKLNLKSDEYGRNENLIRIAREALHAMEKGNW